MTDPPLDDTTWLNTADTATLLGVDKSTLYRWREGRSDKAGPPFYRLPSGSIRYRREDVRRWLALYREEGDPLDLDTRGAA
jgi:predicted DNA-binding transcriptional regulator AlpA